MPFSPGTHIGPYEILDLAGTGGMGEVYRAHDTRLGRTVALKFVLDEAAGEPRTQERFEREARAIAALNHPHICAIYDVGRHEGRDFLVIEFLDGETLEHRLKRGPLGATELLSAATAIAEALAAAHRAGVTHRDLKPANVMLTRAGVKLLDFGIASRRPLLAADSGRSEHDLTTVLGTLEGSLVGTIPYMAPEQVEGRAVDGRTDIFAFGSLMYEMATGQRAFGGGSPAAQIAAILSDSRPRLPETIAMPLAGRIISGCLARDPDDRWQHMDDVRRVLKWAGDPTPDSRTVATSSPWTSWPLHVTWAAVLVAAVALVWILGRANQPQAPPPNPQPVIVLMDSPLPGRVYDPRTAAAGGTNADDVTDALRDLPVAIRKENTSPLWHREEQVATENPDLIVAHLSCLYDQRVAGTQKEIDEHLFDQAENRLLLFFAYLAARNPRTSFIVYSRGQFVERGEANWVAENETRLTVLRGRLHAFTVPGGVQGATFRDPATAKLLRARVTSVLGLAQ